MAAVMVAARRGWFDSYAWGVRANPDVRIEDASFLAARLRKPTVDTVLVRGTARRIPIRKSLDLRSSESSRRTIPWTTFVV